MIGNGCAIVPRDHRKRAWGWPEVAIVVLLSITLLAGLVIAAAVWFVANVNYENF